MALGRVRGDRISAGLAGTVISSFVNPVLFLTAMGLGLGTLVDSSTDDLGVPYLTFVATGLIAATAMQTSAGKAPSPSWPGSSGARASMAPSPHLSPRQTS